VRADEKLTAFVELERAIYELRWAQVRPTPFALVRREQDAKIQQVNDKVELSKPAPSTVLNNQ
jgi:hypothetical protein